MKEPVSESPYEDKALDFQIHFGWACPDHVIGRFAPYPVPCGRKGQGLSVREFLRAPGPYRITYKDNYIILSHMAAMECDKCIESPAEIGVDFWVDDRGRVVKIEQVHRIWNVSDDELARLSDGRNWFELKFPVKSIDCSSLTEFNGKLYPSNAKIQEFWVTSEGRKLLMRRHKGQVTDMNAWKISLYRPDMYTLNSEFIFMDHLVRINEPMPVGFLDISLPPGTYVYTDHEGGYRIVGKDEDTRPWYVRWRFAVLLAACCVITLAIGWAGVRWLGWRS